MARLAFRLALALCFTAPALAAQSPNRSQASVADTTDFLRPGDAIHLRFFGDSAGSGDFRVNESGQVTLPMLGARDATHQDPDLLKKEVTAAYARTFRYAPEVVLLRRITVLGAVAKPGLYLADPTMSITDLLALAGGPMPNGRPDEVQIIRNGQPVTAQVNRRTVLASMKLRSGDELYVPERGWLARNSGLVLGAVGSLVAIVSLVVR